MTIREVIGVVTKGEELTDIIALQCFIAIAGILRTAVQGEPSTFDGEYAALVALEEYGLCNVNVQGLQKFMDKCPNIMDLEVPDSIIRQWAESSE